MKIKISRLDSKFSNYIRWVKDKGICQRCRRQYSPPSQGAHCSHFWGRARKSVRYNVDNACMLCYGCHMYFTGQPEEHRAFMLRRLGSIKYNLLMQEANHPKRPDYKAVEIWLDLELGKAKIVGTIIGSR